MEDLRTFADNVRKDPGVISKGPKGWSHDGGVTLFSESDIFDGLKEGWLDETKQNGEGEPIQVKLIGRPKDQNQGQQSTLLDQEQEKPQERAPEYLTNKEVEGKEVPTQDQDRSEEEEQQKEDPVGDEKHPAKEEEPEIKKSTGKLAQITEHYSNQDIQTIRNTVAKDCNREELGLFLKKAATLGLDPLSGEIWCYKDKKGNVLMFAGRDGYLRVAQQHPEWGGMRSADIRENDDFEADLSEGTVRHKVDIRSNRGKIVGSWAKVWRKGCEPSLKVVQLEDYDKEGSAWKTNKPDMVVVPSQKKALKEAFPLSGVQDDMNWRTDDQGYAVPVNTTPPANQESRHAETLGELTQED